MSYVCNSGHTGLFYKKISHRIYVGEHSNKCNLSGKQVKENTRITSIVCTAVDFAKVPLVHVEKPKKHVCFRQAKGRKPPIA